MFRVVRRTRYGMVVISEHKDLHDANLKVMTIANEFNFTMDTTTKELVNGMISISKMDTLTLCVESC